jgi:hypothetical protein
LRPHQQKKQITYTRKTRHIHVQHQRMGEMPCCGATTQHPRS